MNGVTGRMGYRQHLVRSILALREQGGLDLGDGTVLWPEPILVGRREHALRALAERHGLEHVSTDVDEVLADPTVDIYFDAQVTSAREEAIKKAIAAGEAHLHREADGHRPRRRPRTRPPRHRRGHQARRRPGQAVPAGSAEAQAPHRRRLLRPDPLHPRRVRLLGLRGRLAGRPAPVLELPRRGRRRHRRRHVPALGVRPARTVRPGEVRPGHRHHPHPAALGRERQALRRHGRRRRLRHLRTRRRRHRPDQLLLGGPGQPRRARGVPGRRHGGLGGQPACATAGSSTAARPPSRSGTRTSPPPRSSATSGRRSPTTASSTTASRPSGSCSSGTSTPTPPTTGTCWPTPVASSSPNWA